MALSVAQWHIRTATGQRLTGSKSASRKPATKKTGKRSRLPCRRRGSDDSTASAMDRSRGASVEDVGQEESKLELYRKIARPPRRVSENKSTRIESDPLQDAESEAMTAPGPPWTKKKGCS